MPDACNLPIVVATRLSLSYPLLISAVPLWAIDYEAPPGQRTFKRCWFSDGGLSSNFPIHLFDGLLPRWPTFGMKLEDFPKGYAAKKDRIYMPLSNFEGFGDAWDRFDEGSSGLARIKGFAASLIDSAINWNDNVLSRLPGNRDRIVRIRLHESEGGMNLNMGHEKIEELGNAGHLAATPIVQRFVDEAAPLAGGNPMGWENHRWIRLRLLVALLEQTMPKVQNALTSTVPGAPAYDAQTHAAPGRDGRQFPLDDAAQAQAVLDALAELSQLADAVKKCATERTAPRPLPELKVRSRL
jgi:predicted acylesterase/phospholipase RssA